MQFDKNDALLVDAFEIVRQNDPATYQKMVDSNWVVSEDVRKAFPHDNLWMGAVQDATVTTSFGATLAKRDIPTAPADETWIIPWMNEAWAEQNDADEATFVATVLVHEYTHTLPTGNGEAGASEAGFQFSAKLPGRDGELAMQTALVHLVQDVDR